MTRGEPDMLETRTEYDFLGEKEIDVNAYYGIQTVRATEHFPITGYRLSTDLIRAFGMVKRASAIANNEIGRLNEEFKDAIVQASEEVIDGEHHDHFIVDPIQGGAGTSINMNANEVIANRALEILGQEKGNYGILSPNNHVNMSQSTNDAFPTAIHIAVIARAEKLLETMQEMLHVFKDKASEFDHVIKMGRTHLQDAVPIRLGQEYGAYAKVIERDIRRVTNSIEHLYEVNIGATAVGTGLNADEYYIDVAVRELTKASGFPMMRADNLVDATQNTDAYTEVSSQLKVCMINMSKIANDLRLTSSGPRTGLNEINLPARQPGSSIMPGKVNPVMAEMINQIAFQVIGNDTTITMASEAGQLELNVMEPVLVFNLLQSIDIMRNGFNVFTQHCVKDISANTSVMRESVERSVGTITALTPHVGYDRASKIARQAIVTGESVRTLCERENILTAEELNIVFDAFEMTNIGVSKLPTRENSIKY